MFNQGAFMKHLLSTKSLATLAVALGALTAAASANAGSDVYFSIGIQSPGFYAQSVPIYVQPQPIYVRPQSIYRSLPGHDVWRINEGRRYVERYRHHPGYYSQNRPYGDMDRDGIRNQYDHDRDGDGVPNRYDRQPNQPYRR
jgi:hypothetical protein